MSTNNNVHSTIEQRTDSTFGAQHGGDGFQRRRAVLGEEVDDRGEEEVSGELLGVLAGEHLEVRGREVAQELACIMIRSATQRPIML